MSDITQTSANVKAMTGSTVSQHVAGATIVAGNLVYLDTGDGNKAKTCMTTTAATALCKGVAINNADDTDLLFILTAGDCDIGGTTVKGTVYTVADNAGKIRPNADNASGDFVTTIGVADGTTGVINISIDPTGVAV